MSELYLPSSLIDEIAEEREREAYERASARTVDTPLWWETGHNGTSLLSTLPDAKELLNEQRGWAQIALRAIMDRVRGLDWFVGIRSFDTILGEFVVTPDPKHPANLLLDRPNPIFDGKMTKMLISGLVAHTGVCYLQKIYDGLGVPVQLWPLPTQQVTPISNDGKVLGAYRVTGHDGLQVDLPEEDVIRIWRPDLRTLYGALGFLGPQASEYDAQKSMTEQKLSFFNRDATPRTALMASENEEAPGEAAKTRFHASWRQSYNQRNGENSGLPAFIPAGFKVHEFTEADNSKDVPLDERWSAQIMAAYGVPAFAVGIDTNVNRATGETTMWAWDQNSIEPMTDLIASAYTNQMMVTDFGPDMCVKFVDFVAPDKVFELATEKQSLDTGKITINEARTIDSMDPVSWGDLPRGTVADSAYDGAVREPTQIPLRTVGAPSQGSPPAPAVRSLTRAIGWDAEEVWQRNEALTDSNEDPYAASQLEIWATQLDSVLRNLAKASGVDLSDVRSGSKRRRAMRRSNVYTRAITADELFTTGLEEWSELYREILGPQRTKLYVEAAEFAHTSTGATEFVLTGFMREDIAALGATQVKDIDTGTMREIQRVLDSATASGDSVGEIATDLTEIFEDRTRAMTVARTEIGMSNQAGTIAGFQSSGQVQQKVWRSSRDGRVRDSHRIDGQIVALDDPFTLLDGDQGMQPLDRMLRVGNVVNCRCFIQPVMVGVVDNSDPDQTNEG